MQNKKHIFNIIITATFLVLLVLPNLVMLLSSHEEKTLEFDIKSPKKALAEFKNYYTENFGLKTELVNYYINFKSNFLNENPIPNRVVKGKNGWYFLGNHNNNVFNNAFGNDDIPDKTLENIAANIKDINTYLASKNIKFYVVIPPDKNNIYKENLPFTLTNNKTKLATLKAYLKSTIDFEVIDLTNTLVKNKTTEELYIKTDTHWNDYGAFLGYKKTMDVINKNIKVPLMNIEDYYFETTIKQASDITNMINLKSETKNILLNKITKTKVETKSTSQNLEHYINPNRELKLLMHRDSFANAWVQFFNESFGESIYIRSYTLDKNLIEKEQPDIVVFEIIERNITELAK